MAEHITLSAADGHEFEAWRALPAGRPKGGIVLIHAVFGLTPHLAGLCDDFAACGYGAIAPSFYDRVGRSIVHPYDRGGVEAGRETRARLGEHDVLGDARAAASALREAECEQVAVLGFCTGGTWCWWCACAGGFDAAVVYYGSNVWDFRDRSPECPVVFHYGDADAVVPMGKIDAIRTAHPGQEMHVYPGRAHAFYNPDQPESHCPEAAALARARTLAFLDRWIAGTQADRPTL